MKELDQTQLALAHLLVYLVHNEPDAVRRLLVTKVFNNAVMAVHDTVEKLDSSAFEVMKKPEIDADEYTLAALQEMVLAWDTVRDAERKRVEGWSVVPTADRKGVAIKCMHHARDKEVCVAYRDGALQVNVYRDGEDAPLLSVN